MNESTQKKSHKSLIIIGLVLLALAFVYFKYFYTNTSNSHYFVIEGQKPANLELFLEVGYGSSGENCEHHSIGTGGTYQESDHKMYKAEVSENGTHYRFNYPVEYSRKGCDFSSGFAQLKAKLYKDGTLKTPYDREIDGVLLEEDAPSKYFDISGIEIWEKKIDKFMPPDSPLYNQKRVDYFCQKAISFSWNPEALDPYLRLRCRTTNQRNTFSDSRIIYTVDYVYNLGKAILNIKFSDSFQCTNCTKKLKEKGYKELDTDFKPKQQYFKEFDK